MINNILKLQLSKYNTNSLLDIKNSLKEVLQNIILCELSKTDFFEYAVFYGGTSLRIFENLNRFSEELDFSLIIQKDISLLNYVEETKDNFKKYDISFNINSKEKSVESSVESVYLDFNFKKLIEITFPEYLDKVLDIELLKIKVELEKEFVVSDNTEFKLLMFPSFSQIRTYKIETFFASKIRAILNRTWKTRVKGRDYYDYLFYVSNNVKIDLAFLNLSLDELKQELIDKFNNVDFESAKKDVIPFIKKDDMIIEGFKKEIFLATIDNLKEL